ncbi:MULTISPECIES: hypothetical protein [Peribacillus]|uniref:hypothetical protein n=1 Tax=Peribacillus TaxID=2675229 RepID=UPI00191263C3|nr:MULTISPECIES: hypothetical protein [unclassified Peribacillus]MBK5444640.1 hypothetical protein [Peribacillus sp. TH24]MBK5460654.1 hypothetical protein [Peribacillus sp. TH27]MBK5482438.1 hypothetical protein [Peribacillus sp. TH16]MBK5498802.1 hypothetical protein [Peribacillus sp. TH14]
MRNTLVFTSFYLKVLLENRKAAEGMADSYFLFIGRSSHWKLLFERREPSTAI